MRYLSNVSLFVCSICLAISVVMGAFGFISPVFASGFNIPNSPDYYLNQELLQRQDSNLPAKLIIAKENQSSTEQPSNEQSDTSVEPQLTKKQLSSNTLKVLLLAEIAFDRGMLETGLQAYVTQSFKTRDTNVIQRGLEMSNALNKTKTSFALVDLWQDIEPENSKAHAAMATQQLLMGKVEEAIATIERVLALGGDYDFEVFNRLVVQLDESEQRETLDKLEPLSQSYPKRGDLWLSISYLQAWLKENDAALRSAKQAMKLDKNNVKPVIMHAQLRFNAGKKKQALKEMERGLKKFPNSHRLHLNYVENLFNSDKADKAAKHVIRLQKEHPHAYELLFQAAMLCVKFETYTPAKKLLNYSIENAYRVEQSVLVLSDVAEAENDLPLAINYLQAILPGQNFPQARLRLAYLMNTQYGIEAATSSLEEARKLQPQVSGAFYLSEANLLSTEKHYQKAYQVLSKALIDSPYSIDLLYGRSLVAERLDKLHLAESDLLKVLELEPNNAMALNALGYTLTNKTDRHEEALVYIEKAYHLEPNDPAILDSMGWVYYNLNDYEKALSFLRDALALQQDDEIAAHLGEVLWVSGSQTEAKQVWDTALNHHQDSQILKDVMRRFLK